MAVEDLSSWVCPACQLSLATRFCPTCGELRPGKHDLSLVGLVEHVAETVGHLDGRFLRSFRMLVLRPGSLTDAYWKGQRKPFVGPLPLFLIANLVFFALQSLAGAHVFSTSLASHMSQQFYSGFAREAVANRLAELDATLASYAPIFDHAVAINAKSFIILMVPPFGLLTLLLLLRTRRPFVVHIVFALHFCAFVLLMFCLTLPVSYLLVRLGASGASGSTVDVGLGLVQMSVYAIYLYSATRVVFGISGMARATAVAVMVAASAGIIVGYRFVVFLLTLYTTPV